MALKKWGQKDSGQYSVYKLPTSNLDLPRTRGDKYETRPQKAKLEAEEEQRLQAQCEKTQNSIL